MAEHFNRIPEATGLIREYRNDRSLGVVAEGLMDFVTDYEFGSHGESSTPQALLLVRLMCGFFAIHKLSPSPRDGGRLESFLEVIAQRRNVHRDRPSFVTMADALRSGRDGYDVKRVGSDENRNIFDWQA